MMLSIDIETYSSVDLVKSGVYAYAAAPDFDILLFACAFDEDPEPKVYDLASGQVLPPELMKALTDPKIIKTAYNANFERTCIAKFFNIKCDPAQWRCSAVHAAELGLPPSLEAVANVLGLEERKDGRGKELIKYFCKPCKPTQLNGGRTRNLPRHEPERWQQFKEYCRQDVVVERCIRNRLSKYFPLPSSEQQLWEYDQRINDRGVNVDMDIVRNAIRFNEISTSTLKRRSAEITKLENPNSVAQLKKWVGGRTGVYPDCLNKAAVAEIIEKTNDNDVKEVLSLRLKTGKTSIGKYKAMNNSVCGDGRIRGLLQFYGANRTGRWAGRIVQVQNLPQNHIKQLEMCRELVRQGEYESLDMLYDSMPAVLSELIRTALIPSEGRRFIVSDFSAIEARLIAWLAGEKWRINTFKRGGDIYCASASQMFHVPVEKHGINGHLRQKGKIAELALGYGGSTGALISMGALNMGLSEDDLKPLVEKWRNASPRIVRLWKRIERAAVDAVNNNPSVIDGRVGFIKRFGMLIVTLPSGRSLSYAKPEIQTNKFGRPALTYMGISEGSWTRLETFGGKLTENIVQAIARDCLAESIIRLEDKGYEVNFHVHDEVVLDVPKGVSSPHEVAEIMGEPIGWAEGLELRADAYESEFYKKD